MTGDQLRLLRQRAGLTQQELADRWGLSRETITRYERGGLRIPKWISDAILQVTREHANG
jgi:transcriptional regulator with XRE-family HTH domain